METAVGMAAAILTTIAFIPQAWRTIKTRNTRDISLSMYIVFTIGVACWLTYGILKNDLPIIVANIVAILLAGTILTMKIIYK